MHQWKQTLIEASNQAIVNQLVAPLLSYGANQLVGFVGSSIKKKYRSYKEEKYREEFETLKKDFDAKESLQYTISQDWHKFAIKKGSYGGAIKENNYNCEVLYGRHVADVQHALKKIFGENKHLSEEIREAREINAVTENFNKWLPEKLNRNESELGKELKKKTVSTFRERIIQTVDNNYKTTLQDFRAQAEHADRLPKDPSAVHIADRVNVAQNNIQLEHLVDKSTKLRNDRNIIASVIHAELNKDLLPADQRFNTVAVGIHNEPVYVALNHVETVNGQQTYGITEDKCKELCRLLALKKPSQRML
ncbi:unnamed protein product, partial [Didymodactylos carnosus]